MKEILVSNLGFVTLKKEPFSCKICWLECTNPATVSLTASQLRHHLQQHVTDQILALLVQTPPNSDIIHLKVSLTMCHRQTETAQNGHC